MTGSGYARDRWVTRLAVAISLGCIAVLASTIAILTVPSWAAHFARRPSPSYQVGDRIDTDAAVYAGAARTAIVFAEAQCAGAQASREALKALVEAAGQAEINVVLVTRADPQRDVENGTYAAGIGLPAASIVRTDLASLRLRTLPAVALVSRAGIVTRYHEGAIAPSAASTFPDLFLSF